ncbi:MAG TPA: 16S rRNA (adenine(1518)-N(6)/adenine(1519)-N(6))-dimethyltransferase RsmA [Clostridiaceae bacterium]|jgi:16S rRNA (adenine1518-N6/adenine1519-N6)-dimethyltransferase|nr:16S rRNA (adenine(1518)-N(6)/adenine(1519)-N(6))-dimethyltransferase RsmA [Clostridiaceae bacterium]
MHQSTKELIKKYGIKFTKSLGQNFLVDDHIIKRIADSSDLCQDDLVIEVGSGIGNLTVELARRAGHVIAVEIDRHLVDAFMENIRGIDNITFVNEDILKADLRSIITGCGFNYKNIRLAGNLPYYITTPVIMHFLENGPKVQSMCVMIQKEVADRITAKPGNKNYGALTVAVQFFAEAARLFNVPPHCFIPQPGVDSTVISIKVRECPPVELLGRDCFFKVVKAAFGQRRKTLLNALSNSSFLNLDKEQCKEILAKAGIDEKERGENLSIEQFATLSNAISLQTEK